VSAKEQHREKKEKRDWAHGGFCGNEQGEFVNVFTARNHRFYFQNLITLFQ